MGYTHYFEPGKKLHTPTQWNNFVKKCKKLHSELPSTVKIAGGNGEGEPTFNDKMVDFNGKDAESHETFRIYADPNKNEWDFCKTARKPYDLLAVSVLIAAKKHLKYKFSSDGFGSDYFDPKWKDGIEFYNKVFPSTRPVTEAYVKRG